ncbi:helix-turn-helix domain-containing protein [Petropleomorpha daqingensis]|nr:helix-turn-helix domain-containing protein [Petropleomorpha daqingensis]
MALATQRWRPARLPPDERVDAFREAVSATHLPWSVTPDGEGADDDGLTRYRLGDLALVDCRCGPCSGFRGRSQFAATAEDAVGVLFVRGGAEQVEVAGERYVVRPGSALVWRGDEAVRFRVPGRLHKWTLLVPRTRMPAVGTRLLDGEAVGLLTALLGTAMRSAEALDARLALPVADAAVDLLAGALRPASPSSSEAAWVRVSSYVHRHLRDPLLDPARIAAAAYLSPRSLYALFAARGDTPARYVRRLRLQAAHRDLQRGGAGVTVAGVASSWGFTDQATFGRNFRAAYGRTPDEVRRGG